MCTPNAHKGLRFGPVVRPVWIVSRALEQSAGENEVFGSTGIVFFCIYTYLDLTCNQSYLQK